MGDQSGRSALARQAQAKHIAAPDFLKRNNEWRHFEMAKNKKTDTSQAVKLLSEFVAHLTAKNASTAKAIECEQKLKEELATAASSWPTLAAEERLTLRTILAVVPCKLASNVIQHLAAANGHASAVRSAAKTPERREAQAT